MTIIKEQIQIHHEKTIRKLQKLLPKRLLPAIHIEANEAYTKLRKKIFKEIDTMLYQKKGKRT